MHSSGETWCKNTSDNSNNCPKTRNYPNYALMRVCSLSKADNSSFLWKGRRCNIYAEYTRYLDTRRRLVRGWILKNTRIGRVLDIKICHHEDQYTIEVRVKSLFQDRTASWVRIVNGVDKYVTESMLTKEAEDIASGKPIAKARPRQKPTVTLTSFSIPVRERNLVDIETQRSLDHECYEVSKAITRLLRHDQPVFRGNDGAIHYSDIIEECRKKLFDDASQWLLGDWISILGYVTMKNRERSREKISMLRESKLFQSMPVPSSNSRTCRRECC